MTFLPLHVSSVSPVTPVLFPLHRTERSAAKVLHGQRGRLVTSRFEGGSHADASTFTGMHDGHNHSFGPGYSHAQISDFASPLSDGVYHQLALLDAAGVMRILWMPIPTNIEGGPLTHCCGDVPGIGRTYYMPNCFRDGRRPLTSADLEKLYQVDQYYNTSVDWQVAKAWTELPDDVRKRLLPAITGINLKDPNSIHAVMRLKKEYPGVFHWMGEITICKGVVQQQNRDYQPSFATDAALHKHLGYAGRTGMGVTLHCDVSDEARCVRTGRPGKSENLADVRHVFAAHPDTTIAWAHLGGLGRFAPPSRHHVRNLREVLKAHPNVNIDMSWSDVATWFSPHPKPASNLSEAQRGDFDAKADRLQRRHRIRRLAELIEEFPDRFIMGSDALVSHTAQSISSSYGIYSNLGQGPGTATPGGGREALFDFLSTDTQAKVLHGNFDRLYDKAQAASLRYEAHGLQRDMDGIHQQMLEQGRTPNQWPGEPA